MAKRYTSRKRKRVNYRRKKTFKTKGARIGRKIQNASYSYVKKKYTTTLPMKCQSLVDRFQRTVSHVGNRNSSGITTETITLFDCDPDGMTTRDMASYQYFKITGVSLKMFFPEGTTPAATPA